MENQPGPDTGGLDEFDPQKFASLLNSPIAAGVYGATQNEAATGGTAGLEGIIYALSLAHAARQSGLVQPELLPPENTGESIGLPPRRGSMPIPKLAMGVDQTNAQEALHVTPAKFKGFDMDFLGTGEGSKVPGLRSEYGRGMYFTKDPRELSYYKGQAKYDFDPAAQLTGETSVPNVVRAAIPKSERLLQWNTPLKDNPAPIRERLPSLPLPPKDYEMDTAGGSLYRSYLRSGADVEHQYATEQLLKADIPGAQYRGDQSEGAPLNYSIWDPTAIKLLRPGQKLPKMTPGIKAEAWKRRAKLGDEDGG